MSYRANQRPVVFGTMLGLVVVSFLVYGASLNNNFVASDDPTLIFENPNIRSIRPSTLKAIFTSFDPELYIPLTFLSYQIDYLVGGPRPFVFHLSSLLLHVVNAVLVFLLTFRLSKRMMVGIFCGFLFALHPINTEAVAWASDRKDVLATFFFLASLLQYESYTEQPDDTWRLRWSLVLFGLGGLAKVSVVTLPAILLLLDWRKRRRWTKDTILEKLPFVAVSAALAAIAVAGKSGVLAKKTLAELVLLLPVNGVFTLKNVFSPVNLAIFYPYGRVVYVLSAEFLGSCLMLVALIACAFVLVRWNRDLFVGVAYFGVTLLPSLVALPAIYHSYDRFAYLPMIGLLFAVGTSLAKIDRTQQVDSAVVRLTSPLGVITIALVVVLGFMAHKQSFVWQNSETLFTNVVENYPEAADAHASLGSIYRDDGKFHESRSAYEAALQAELDRESATEEDKTTARVRYAANLGSVSLVEGKLAEAIDHLQRSIAIRPSVQAYSNLASAYRQRDEYELAIDAYRRAIAIDPEYSLPYHGLALIFVKLGDYQMAEEYFRATMEVDPLFETAQINLAKLYLALGNANAALSAFEKAAWINPASVEAEYNRGNLLLQLRQYQDAINALRRALRIDPYNADVRSRLNLAEKMWRERSRSSGR